jgi:hypothetical protein
MSDEKEEKTPQEKVKEALERRNGERLQLMESIADASEMGRKEDIEGIDKGEPDEEQVVAEAAARALQEEGATAEVKGNEAEEGDTRVIDGVTYYLTIVNGREKWLTLQQLRQTASKVEAADEYLRNASEAARTAAREALSPRDTSSGLEEDEARKLLAAAALGDEEAIGRLARAITAKPSVTPDVLQALDQRLSFRTELAALEAEQKDLLGDPNLGLLFRAKLNELKQKAPETPLSDAYRGIGTELRKAFPGYKGSKTQDKLERKRTLVQVPNAAQRQQTETEDDGEEDPSAVIERLAKARGQSPHLHRRQ